MVSYYMSGAQQTRVRQPRAFPIRAARRVAPLIGILAMVAPPHPSAEPTAEGAIGEQRVLVIMARFPGIEPSFSPEQMRVKYFERLDTYLRLVSGGKANVTGKVTGWHTLPHPVRKYRISQHNLEVDRGRVMQLIQDAVDLADRDEDFSKYSMIFLSLGVERDEYGMMGLCGYPGMLGWRNDVPITTKGKRQKIPGGIAIYCERAHVGVVFHDMAHIMGGVKDGKRVVPCLYDHDLQGRTGPFRGYAQFYLIHLGYFDPMSCHMFEPDQGPPGVCAWTALRLGWIPANKLLEVPKRSTRTVSLGALHDPDANTVAIRLPLTATTYYLLENRQPIGPDRNLPSHGVLISFCDDGVAECRKGEAPLKLVNADPSVPELKGAPFTTSGRRTYQDARRHVSIDLLSQKGRDIEIRIARDR